MKRYFIVVVIVIIGLLQACVALSQNSIVPVDEDTKLITYREVVNQEGDANKLYNLAISWINANYENPTEVTRIRDVENGKIEVRHRFKVFNIDKKGVKTDAYVILYTLKLEFKPNRYRYTFTDFQLQALSKFLLERWLDKSDPQYSPLCDEYLTQVDTYINKLIESLKVGMTPKIVKPDEW